MKLHYYADTDSLYVELKDAPGVETREVVDGLNVDVDASGDLTTLEVDALPVQKYRAGYGSAG